jgi:hypothetical protein
MKKIAVVILVFITLMSCQPVNERLGILLMQFSEGSRLTCGEGVNRSELELFGVQNELVEAIHKTGKPIVVVLMNGRPLTINYIAENINGIRIK